MHPLLFLNHFPPRLYVCCRLWTMLGWPTPPGSSSLQVRAAHSARFGWLVGLCLQQECFPISSPSSCVSCCLPLRPDIPAASSPPPPVPLQGTTRPSALPLGTTRWRCWRARLPTASQRSKGLNTRLNPAQPGCSAFCRPLFCMPQRFLVHQHQHWRRLSRRQRWRLSLSVKVPSGSRLAGLAAPVLSGTAPAVCKKHAAA